MLLTDGSSDEPLSALDIKVRERLRREIAAVQKKVGITTLFLTHDSGRTSGWR
jgi:ABC-type Fe3+/spermidine/putrescine transport system ATPase subunit